MPNRRRPYLLVLLALLLIVGIAFFRTDRVRASTARSILRLEFEWVQHWPWQFGRYAPTIFDALWFKTGLLPARVDIEPGISLLLDPRDLVDREILLKGVWQPKVLDSISAGLAPGAVFMDVGAHIGYYTMLSSPRVGGAGKVISFEPNPATRALLEDNVRANGFQNVIVQPIACTDKDQMLTLYAGTEANTGTASLSEANAEAFGATGGKSYQVRGRPIDDVVRDLGLTRVDVMKIDVEGAEFMVLKGALGTLQRFHPRIVIELIPRQLAAMGATMDDVNNLFLQAGYDRKRQIDVDDFEWTSSRR